MAALDESSRRPEQSNALSVSHPDLEWRETVRGSKPGDSFVRIATHKGFTRVGRGHLVPRPGTGAPTSGIARSWQLLNRLLFGRKFALGAWMVLVIVPVLVGILWATHQHYQRLALSRRAETPMQPDQVIVRAVVPVAEIGVPSRQALTYARAVAPDDAHVVAVHVTHDVASAANLRRRWQEWEPGVQMVIIESPYRSLGGPLLAYIDALKDSNPRDTITVVLPEYVPSHWWEHLLYNQTALRLKAALLFDPGVVVTNVPYHMAASNHT